ncbi:MAG: alpha-N-arabinofuranosidase [Phycisphaerae bacterium]|nr:alpha-N-arabinofuranosidase [Phycisphaerae bacterium]
MSGMYVGRCGQPGIAWVMVLSLAAAALANENLLDNADFEALANGQPRGWTPHTWAGAGEYTVVEPGRAGGHALQISAASGGDLSWQAQVTVKPAGVYRLSGWIRTADVNAGSGRGALLNVHELPGAATRAVTGTQDWTHVESIVRVGDREQITVHCLFGGWGQSTGTAAYDDLRLEELDLRDVQPHVTVFAQRKRAPIDPFIYGQFIEHLGRCIYGGIWAEMLEDRKFYFPIEVEYRPYRAEPHDRVMLFPVVARSPWQIIGPAAGVTMERAGAFVGEHTPLLQPGAAIQQNDLNLVAGRQYAGYVWLKSTGTARVTVTLSGADGVVEIPGVAGNYARHPFAFTARETTDTASLRIAVAEAPAYVGTVSLMPADNVQGLRKDTLELIRQLNAPIYRWPGGNFVSGYDWRDGIGDRDRRSPRKNPAWSGVEHNDFGIDEFMVFCRLAGTEPLIAVNTGFGDAYSAAQEVEYCNGGVDTLGGQWRAANGHAEPYGVRWWCIGNEMYGDWQLGHMRLEHYVLKHNAVVDRMRAVDSGLQLVGVGAVGDWSRGMLRACAGHMDFLSEHFYCGVMDDVVSHVQQIPLNIRRIADAHRAYRREIPGLVERNIRIALDEWNYWSDRDGYVYGDLGARYRQRDALGVAAGLHEYFRQSDVFKMANYAQTVNVIGCIKTTKTAAFLDTTALPLMLYRAQFGTVPLEIEGNAELLALDVAAAWTEASDALTIAVVNPNATAVALRVDVDGANPDGAGAMWQIAHDDPNAYNDAQNQRVKIVPGPFTFDGQLRVPAYGVALYRVNAK